jgi:hypothetical protein
MRLKNRNNVEKHAEPLGSFARFLSAFTRRRPSSECASPISLRSSLAKSGRRPSTRSDGVQLHQQQGMRTNDCLRCSADIGRHGTHHKNVSGTARTYMSCVWFQELGNFFECNGAHRDALE